jgi:hypothetical protein
MKIQRLTKIHYTRSWWLFWYMMSKVFWQVILFHRLKLWMHCFTCFSCSAIRDKHSGLAETTIIIHDNTTRLSHTINHLTPNVHFSGRTAPLTYRRCILYIYSTNIRTEYFKRAAHSAFFSSSKCRLFHNATFFGSCIIHILNTGCAKI